jgi:hypothetical protein
MHIIHHHQTSVTLFQRNGEVVVFASMQAALKKLGYGWIAANVGPHFRIFSHYVFISFDGRRVHNRKEIGGACIQHSVYTQYNYVMRDDLGPSPLNHLPIYATNTSIFLRVAASAIGTAMARYRARESERVPLIFGPFAISMPNERHSFFLKKGKCRRGLRKRQKVCRIHGMTFQFHRSEIETGNVFARHNGVRSISMQITESTRLRI